MRGRTGALRSAAVLAAVLAGAGTPAGGTTLFALVDTGEMFASTDAGASWTVRSALPVTDAAGLIAGHSPSELFLASERGAVYRSGQGGADWSAVGVIPASDVVDITALDGNVLLLLTRAGVVWRSSDGGAGWECAGALDASDLVSFAASANGQLHAVTATGGVAVSLDGGAHWDAIGTLPASDAVAIRAFSGSLVVLTATGYVWRSLDGGRRWLAAGTTSQVHMADMTELPNELAVTSLEGMVARSPDGMSWRWVGTVNQVHVVALSSDTPQMTGVPEASAVPRLLLRPPAPNPCRGGSVLTVRFSLPGTDRVALELFDAGGRRVAAREAESFAEAGEHAIRWRPGSLPGGVYYLRLAGGHGLQASQRIALVP